ncbi:MAG: lysylphosphatidylglycerol synthase transmembrane domain-containing protein [Acidimicrobiales bacterium]
MLSLFLIVHYLVVPELSGARESASVLARLSPWLAVVAVFAEAGSLVAYALLARTLLAGSDRPSLSTILRIQLSTLAASHVVPGGSAAGAALGYRLLRKTGVSASNAGFLLGAQSLGSAAVLSALLWVAVAVSVPLRGANDAYVGVALAGTVVMACVVALIIGVSRETRAAVWYLRAIGRVLHLRDSSAVARSLRDLIARFRALATDRELLVRAAGWAALQWLADAMSLWLFLAAIGIRMDPDALLIAFGLANVSAAIPLTPGGLAVYEAVLTSSLVGFGVPRAEAIIGVLAYRLFEFWIPIPVGAITFLTIEAAEPETGGRVDALEAAFEMAASKHKPDQTAP